jgi:hypothetical protein
MVEMSPHDITREINLDNFLIKGWWTVDIVDAGLPPILTMFDDYNLERITGNTHIAMYAKPGSTIWATMRGARDPRGREDPPFMVSWRWGEGLVWAIAQDYDREWWGVVPGLSSWDHQINPVSPDIVLNMLYFSVGRTLPDDIVIVHDVRSWYGSLGDSRRLFLSVLEFIERFGADTNPLVSRMAELKELEVEAEELFWEGRYVESLEPLKQAVEELKEIENDAIKTKAEALFWVYVIEWLAVSSAGMTCGFILWTVMVRRRLYREVGGTRLARYGE